MHGSVERRWLVGGTVVFLLLFFVPVDQLRLPDLRPLGPALHEGLALLHWYAREHVILCLLPAFLIAGAMTVFISRQAVLRYLGPGANRLVAMAVASVSGTVLAVCSCTILPLFGGLYRRGAGIGPAVAFLYAGPAINVLAIVMTAKVLGPELGLARALAAIGFAVVIGGMMQVLFPDPPGEAKGFVDLPDDGSSVGVMIAFFATMVGVLVFANWATASPTEAPLWAAVAALKWWLAGSFALAFGLVLILGVGWPAAPLAGVGVAVLLLALLLPEAPQLAFAAGLAGLALLAWRRGDEARDWMEESWGFAKLILPLLLVGVFVAGALLGRPGAEGLIPSAWVAAAVGGEGVGANLMASVVGALMYFATLTEVPIVQALRGAGMGEGPSLALLLAGPALSLPSMLAIHGIMGTRKTAAYVALVVVMATASGVIYGALVA
jgi:uncharacterized membrane protein YraQ (UPF0718 family)